MKKYILPAMIVASVFAASCGNQSTDPKKEADKMNDAKADSARTTDTGSRAATTVADMKPDAKFAVAAADGGRLEVQLGKMAVEKGTSPEIKKLGAMMVTDHTKANEELKATAAAKNITLPDALSDKCQKMVSDLSSKTGADFDKAYADMMVSDHKEDIDDFKKEGDKGNDPELSAWARGKVPVLEHHLATAEQAKKVVDKK